MSIVTPETQWVEIARGKWSQLNELALLLGSQFLPYRLEHHAGDYSLWVPDFLLDKVRMEIEVYQTDNPPRKKWTQDLPKARAALMNVLLPPLIGTAWGVFGGNYPRWKEIGLANAELIRSGHFERAVTALTLHADSQHLFSNLMAAWLFAFFLQSHLSLGLLSLLILVAGFGANLTEAFMVEAHRSLGFSTATFAMLGVLVVFESHQSVRQKIAGFRPWILPLSGGFLLAVLTGVSQEVDVLAHALGFVWGAALSIPFLGKNNGAHRIGGSFLLISWMIYVLNWAIAVYFFGH